MVRQSGAAIRSDQEEAGFVGEDVRFVCAEHFYRDVSPSRFPLQVLAALVPQAAVGFPLQSLTGLTHALHPIVTHPYWTRTRCIHPPDIPPRPSN